MKDHFEHFSEIKNQMIHVPYDLWQAVVIVNDILENVLPPFPSNCDLPESFASVYSTVKTRGSFLRALENPVSAKRGLRLFGIAMNIKS
jgi:hypothetical protein